MSAFESKKAKSFSSFFRPKKEASEQGLVRNKSFKRIRGLLKGESRKERKARKESKKAQALAAAATGITVPSPGSSVCRTDDDAETVYGVDVDDSVASSFAPSPPRPVPSPLLSKHQCTEEDDTDRELNFTANKQIFPPIQVILLVMDPATRRFELVQLEFDSNDALVKDVLAQIPHSVTSKDLRKRSYTSIADCRGTELILSLRLSTFCPASEVLVAIPAGISAKRCVHLARPILSDDKVISMVSESQQTWQNVVGIFFCAYTHKCIRRFTFFQLQSSGIAVPCLMESTSDPHTVVEEPSTLIEESPILIEESSAPIDESGKTENTKKKSVFNTIFTILLIALLAFGVQVSHFYVSSPLEPGHRLSPGSIITKCGLLFFMPSCTSNPSLEMGMDGVMTLYGADKLVEWTIAGGICESFEGGCMNGAILNIDGSLVIGGKVVSTVTAMGMAPLEPWPFAVSPKVRVIRGRK